MAKQRVCKVFANSTHAAPSKRLSFHCICPRHKPQHCILYLAEGAAAGGRHVHNGGGGGKAGAKSRHKRGTRGRRIRGDGERHRTRAGIREFLAAGQKRSFKTKRLCELAHHVHVRLMRHEERRLLGRGREEIGEERRDGASRILPSGPQRSTSAPEPSV